MAKLQLKGASPAVLQGLIEGQEIRGITYQFPEGPVAGYEWRLQIRRAGAPGQPETTDWTPWIFGSHESVRAMLAQWSQFLAENPPLDRPSQLQ